MASGGIKSQLTGFYDKIHSDGVQNVQWGSCSAPLTVTVFMIMSMGKKQLFKRPFQP